MTLQELDRMLESAFPDEQTNPAGADKAPFSSLEELDSLLVKEFGITPSWAQEGNVRMPGEGVHKGEPVTVYNSDEYPEPGPEDFDAQDLDYWERVWNIPRRNMQLQMAIGDRWAGVLYDGESAEDARRLNKIDRAQLALIESPPMWKVWESLPAAVADQSPILQRTWKTMLTEAGPQAALGAAAGGVTGFGAGLLLGGPTGEEPLMAAAGMRAGARVFGAKAMMDMTSRMEAGFAYEDLVTLVDDYGVSEDLVAAAARGVGAINGALEFVGLHEVAMSAGLDKVVRKGITAAVKKAAEQGLLKTAVKEAGKRYAKGIAAEVATELQQEVTGIIAGELVAYLNEDKDVPHKEWGEMLTQLAEVAEKTVLSTAGIMTPGVSYTSIQEARLRRRGIATTERMDRKQAQEEAALRMTEEVQAEVDAAREAAAQQEASVSPPADGPDFDAIEIQLRAVDTDTRDPDEIQQHLDDIDMVLTELREMQPPRGERKNHPTTRLIRLANNLRSKIQTGVDPETQTEEQTDEAIPERRPEAVPPDQGNEVRQEEGQQGRAADPAEPGRQQEDEQDLAGGEVPPAPPAEEAPGASPAVSAPGPRPEEVSGQGRRMSPPSMLNWSDIKRGEFQPRTQEADQGTVNRVRDDFVSGKLDLSAAPLVVWKDEKGQFHVLAGNSRHKGIEEGMGELGVSDTAVPVVEFNGTREEAMVYAETENEMRSQQTPFESARGYRRRIDAGADRKEIEAEIKQRTQKLSSEVVPLTYLNPGGKAAEALVRMPDDKNVARISKWIGNVRRIYSELTDAHENELFDFLLPRIGNAINSQEQLMTLLKRTDLGTLTFDQNAPLNILQRTQLSDTEQAVQARIEELGEEIAGYERELESTRTLIENANEQVRKIEQTGEERATPDGMTLEQLKDKLDGTWRPRRDDLMAAIESLKKERNELQGRATRNAPETISLFEDKPVDVDLRKPRDLTQKPRTAKPVPERNLGERPKQTSKPKQDAKPAARDLGDRPKVEKPKGSGNTVFTDDAAERAREILRRKLGGQANMGLDPETVQAGITLAGYYIEAGARSFAAYSKKMIEDLGEAVKPYLRAWYEAVRYYPGFDSKGMTLAEDIDNPKPESKSAPSATQNPKPEQDMRPDPQTSARQTYAQKKAETTGRPPLVVQDEDVLPDVPSDRVEGIPDAANSWLGSDQRFGINLMLRRFIQGGEAFLLADGTGVGKTAQIVSVAHVMANRTGKPSLVVTQNKQVIAGSFKSDAASLGMTGSNIVYGTYDDLRTGKLDKQSYGVVIFDEAHNLKNVGSQRSMAELNVKADHRVYATATPMDRAWGGTYFMARITGKSEADVQKQMGIRIVEDRDKNGQIVARRPVLNEGMSAAKVRENLLRMRQEAAADGALLRREYPFYGEITEEVIEMPGEFFESQEEALEYWNDRLDSATSPRTRMNISGQKTLEMSRLTEVRKALVAVPRILAEIRAGRKVIVTGELVNSTTVKGLNGQTYDGSLSAIEKALRKEGIAVARIFGTGDKAGEIEKFQSGQVGVALMTPQSGGTGVNLDDAVGDAPRTMFILSRNFSGDVFDQILGRVSRRNTASPAKVVFLDSEAWADARRRGILEGKLDTLRAIQRGVIDDSQEIMNEIAEADPAKARQGGGRKNTLDVDYANGVIEVSGDGTYGARGAIKRIAMDAGVRLQFNQWKKSWILGGIPKDKIRGIIKALDDIGFEEESAEMNARLTDEALDQWGGIPAGWEGIKAYMRNLQTLGFQFDVFFHTDESTMPSKMRDQSGMMAFVGTHMLDPHWNSDTRKYEIHFAVNRIPAGMETRVFWHEVVGHYGVELLGAEFISAMESLVRALGGRQFSRFIKNQRVFDGQLDGIADEVFERYAFPDDKELAREIIAHYAERYADLASDNTFRRLWAQLRVAMRKALNRLGWTNPHEAMLDELIFSAVTNLGSAGITEKTGRPYYDHTVKMWQAGTNRAKVQGPQFFERFAARYLSDEELKKAVKGSYLRPIGKAFYWTFRNAFSSIDAKLRKLAKKYPAVGHLADRAFAPPTRDDVIAPTMYQRITVKVGEFFEGIDVNGARGLHIILKKHKLNKKQLQRAVYLVRHGLLNSKDEAKGVVETARMLRDWIDRFGDYLEDAGMISEEARKEMGPNYFPQIWDEDLIEANKGAAIHDFMTEYLEDPHTYVSSVPFGTEEEANEEADKLRGKNVETPDGKVPRWADVEVVESEGSDGQVLYWIHMTTGEGQAYRAAVTTVNRILSQNREGYSAEVIVIPHMRVANFVSRAKPGMTKKRKIHNVVGNARLERWLQKNPEEMLSRHAFRGIQATEYERAFGVRGSRIKAVKRLLVQQGASEDEIVAVEQAGQAWANRLGADASTATRGARRLTTGMMVITAIRIMGFAALTSMSEFGATAGRLGFRNTAIGFTKAVADLIPIVNKLTKKESRIVARAIGLNSRMVVQQALNGIVTGEHLSSRVLGFYYIANLLEPITRLQRMTSYYADKRFIQQIVRNYDKGGRWKRWGAQLGLGPEQIADIRKNGYTDANGIPRGAFAFALVRGVEQSIMKPDPSMKPAWMSDQRMLYRFAAMLKSYIYAFRTNYIPRAISEAKHGNFRPFIALVGVIPAIQLGAMAVRTYAIVAAYNALAQALGWSLIAGDDEDKDQWAWVKKYLDAFDRGGATAAFPLLADVLRSVSYRNIAGMVPPIAFMFDAINALQQAGRRAIYDLTSDAAGQNGLKFGSSRGNYKEGVRFLMESVPGLGQMKPFVDKAVDSVSEKKVSAPPKRKGSVRSLGAPPPGGRRSRSLGPPPAGGRR